MMMDMQSQYDVELEDGELSSDSSDNVYNTYTPLQRPTTMVVSATATKLSVSSGEPSDEVQRSSAECSPLLTCHKMQQALEEEQDDDSQTESSSDLSSDSCLKKLSAVGPGSNADLKTQQRRRRKRVKRTVMVRVQRDDAASEVQEKRARFKKYNVWTEALQEEALTENMRGCDVTRRGCKDRNVENYDFSLRRAGSNGGGRNLKRRFSNSTDDISDSGMFPTAKRIRQSHLETGHSSIKSRLGPISSGGDERNSSPYSSGSDNSYKPRHIPDINNPEGRDPIDVAREIANKLYEEKDDLLLRIVDVLGTELPVEIYKETQRIEADGGMSIKNGKRRRTPGGVFLFLLKHHDNVTSAQMQMMFNEDRKNAQKWRKEQKSKSRDRKVEELKKRLSEKEKHLLPALRTRKEHLLGADLVLENQTTNRKSIAIQRRRPSIFSRVQFTVSNPPPSPVGNEHSPEYKTHAINHVAVDISTDKPSTSGTTRATLSKSPSGELESYDFVDDTCGDMEFW